MSVRKALFTTCVASALLLAGYDVQADDAAASASADAAAAPAAASGFKFDLKSVNTEDLRDYNNTIVVPTAFVRIMVKGKVFVAKQGSALSEMATGGSANTVRASANYKLEGMDKALAQNIAQKAYDDFVAKLRNAGYTVLTYDDIKDRDFIRGADREKPDSEWGVPTDSPRGSSDTYLVASPTDEQAFASGMAGGTFNQFIHFGKPLFTDATIVIPTYTIVSPRAGGKTEATYSTISAEVNVSPSMAMPYASVFWMGKPKVRIMHGMPGVVSPYPFGNLTDHAGELTKEDTTSKAGNAFAKGLSLLTGFGSVTGNSANYTLKIDHDAYLAGAMNGIGAFNTEVARIAQEAK